MTGPKVHAYRGQRVTLNTGTPAGRKGRYTWNGEQFAQLAHAKAAIDDHLSGAAL